MKNKGFSLIELMVVLVVLAVLASLAIPSFTGLIRASRLSAQANDFYAALSLARSEAVKRNSSVSVCASSDGAACAASWSSGWLVRLGTNGTVLQVYPALSAGNTLVAAGALASVVFLPSGQAQQAASFELCGSDDSVNSSQSRNIQVSLAGRVQSTKPGTCN